MTSQHRSEDSTNPRSCWVCFSLTPIHCSFSCSPGGTKLEQEPQKVNLLWYNSSRVLVPFPGAPTSPPCALLLSYHPGDSAPFKSRGDQSRRLQALRAETTPKEMEGDTTTLVSPLSLHVLPPGVQTPVVSPVGTHTRRDRHNSTEVLRRVSTSETWHRGVRGGDVSASALALSSLLREARPV